MIADRKRRLLVLASTYPKSVGGSEPSFVFDLNSRLIEQFDVVCLVPHFQGGALHERTPAGEVYRFIYAPPALEKLAYGGGILSNLKANKWLYLLVPFFFVAQFCFGVWILWARKIDVIHAHWILPQGLVAVLVALFKPGVKVVCTSHGGDLFGLNGRIVGYLMRFVLSKIDKLTVVSHTMKEHVERMGWRCKDIEVIPMGVDISHFSEEPEIGVNRQRLLFVGRLVEKKGIVHLLNAVGMLRDEGVKVELCVAGAGPLFAQCKETIDRLKLGESVMMLGAVAKQDLPQLYRSCSICVVPSVIDQRGDQEGLGLVIVEALSTGRVVLASDLEAIKDVIQHEKNGLLFRAGDPTAIKDAIKMVLMDEALYLRLKVNARRSILDKFDLRSVARRYALVLGSGD